MTQEDTHEIRVFGNDDESLKILGQLLSNDTSRKIIQILSEKEMYTNEIAKSIGIKMNLVLHHLKKLEELGLVTVTHKKIIKKGIDHKYYKMIPNVFVTPNQSKEEINNSRFLKKFFKKGIKFAGVGIAAISSYFITQPRTSETFDRYVISDEPPSDYSDLALDVGNQTVTYVSTKTELSDSFTQVASVILVVALGLFLIYYSKNKKN